MEYQKEVFKTKEFLWIAQKNNYKYLIQQVGFNLFPKNDFLALDEKTRHEGTKRNYHKTTSCLLPCTQRQIMCTLKRRKYLIFCFLSDLQSMLSEQRAKNNSAGK